MCEEIAFRTHTITVCEGDDGVLRVLVDGCELIRGDSYFLQNNGITEEEVPSMREALVEFAKGHIACPDPSDEVSSYAGVDRVQQELSIESD